MANLLSGVRNYLSGIWRAVRGLEGGAVSELYRPRWATESERYQHLRAYRSSEDLYGRLRDYLKAGGYAGYKDIRNPAQALAELYAFKLPEGTLDNLEGPENLKTLTERILKDGNWADRSEVAARDYAVTGDLYLKAVNTEDRAFPQWIDPAHVTDGDEDDRGHFSFLRLDIPQTRRVEGEPETYIETEVWDKAGGYHAVYEHDGGPDTPLADLLKNSETLRSNVILTLYEELQELPEGEGEYTGFDFIPVVHRKLRDSGSDRGEGAYQHALSGIDESNQMATRFHDLLFPEIAWVLTRGEGPGGEELPPIILESEEPDERLARLDQESQRVVKVGNQNLYRLPSGADLKSLIPSVQIQAHADALAAQVKYVEEHLLPELQYRSLKDQGQLSGRAARIYLSDAVDRIGAARRKYDDGLIRAVQMCLTLGALAGIEGYESVPAYEDRRDAIAIKDREVFPVSELDRLTEGVQEANIRQTYKEMGLLRFRLEEEGLDEERIKDILRSVQPGNPTPLADLFGAPLLMEPGYPEN